MSEYDFTLAKKINTLASNVRLASDKLRFAESGYAPHYNIVKVDLPNLEEMKRLDEELVSIVNEILNLSKSVKEAASVSTVKVELLNKIGEYLSKVDDIMGRRIKVLRGVG
jgi:GTP1/Obg family GTP-binding protein